MKKKGIKPPAYSIKVNREVELREKRIKFDFQFLTCKTDYTLSKEILKGRGSICVEQFIKKLKELGNFRFNQLFQCTKKTALDLIERRVFTVNIFDELDKKEKHSEDTKFAVFRFNSQQCRFITKQCNLPGNDELFHVIAIDLDLSTYSHGK